MIRRAEPGRCRLRLRPRECEDGAACRVHIALHGCLQDTGDVDRHFIDDTGYNAWADTNRLIVLYPQAAKGWEPYNPLGCWDWWSYVDHEDSYVTKSGSQIKTIKAMLDALTARATAAPVSVPTPASDAAPAALTVVDTRTRQRIWHGCRSREFRPIASRVRAPTARSWRWGYGRARFRRFRAEPAIRLSLARLGVVDGIEGPPSTEVSATTRPVPAPCENPGSCPIDK